MPRRSLVAAVIVVAVVIIAAVAIDRTYFSGPPELATMTTVTEYVGGVTTSAPQDWSGVAQGIYAKHNLKVNFVDLAGTSQAVQAVASDRSGLAFTQGDILDEMLIADKNPDAPPLIGISSNEPRNPVAIVFLKSSGIKTPADLKGKKIGVPTGSLSEQYLNVFLQKQGIDKSSVTIQNIGFAAQNAALLQKQVDAIAAFARAIASLEIAVPKSDGIGSFLFGDYDMPSPLGAVVVQKSLLDKNPAVAKAIGQATTEALYYCASNPDQCIKDFVAANQGRDFDQSLAEWKVALNAQYGIDINTVKNVKPLTLGWFDPALVAKTLPELKTLFGIKKDFDPTTLYTNQYVEKP